MDVADKAPMLVDGGVVISRSIAFSGFCDLPISEGRLPKVPAHELFVAAKWRNLSSLKMINLVGQITETQNSD